MPAALPPQLGKSKTTFGVPNVAEKIRPPLGPGKPQKAVYCGILMSTDKFVEAVKPIIEERRRLKRYESAKGRPSVLLREGFWRRRR